MKTYSALDKLVGEVFAFADGRGIAPKQIANATGIELATIYRIRQRSSQNNSMETILKIADAVGLELTWKIKS